MIESIDHRERATGLERVPPASPVVFHEAHIAITGLASPKRVPGLEIEPTVISRESTRIIAKGTGPSRGSDSQPGRSTRPGRVPRSISGWEWRSRTTTGVARESRPVVPCSIPRTTAQHLSHVRETKKPPRVPVGVEVLNPKSSGGCRRPGLCEPASVPKSTRRIYTRPSRSDNLEKICRVNAQGPCRTPQRFSNPRDSGSNLPVGAGPCKGGGAHVRRLVGWVSAVTQPLGRIHAALTQPTDMRAPPRFMARPPGG